MSKKVETPKTIEVAIQKLVHGGQGRGVADDGRKVFCWNSLPGDRVVVELKKSKKSYAEAKSIRSV